jgi:hypothetical protein
MTAPARFKTVAGRLWRAGLRILRFYRDFGAGFVTGGLTVATVMLVPMIAPGSLRLAITMLEHAFA